MASAPENSKFKVQGKSAYGCHDLGDDNSESPTESGSRESGRQSSGLGSEVISESGEHLADDMMSHVIEVNKNLVQQLDALRLRLEVDFKHGQEQRALILKETDGKLDQKVKAVSNLKTEIKEKTESVSQLTDDNERKSKEIYELQRQIEDLRNDIGDTKIYADELESEVSRLQKDKGKLQTGSAYQEKEEEIKGLHREIDFLRRNLSRLEKELTKAKEMIAQQGGKVRLMENENKNSLLKFREELNKISLNMRLEVGRMREVMRSQWREMKDLREQNETMSKDIREIRDLLVEQNKTKGRQTITREQTTTPSGQLQAKSEHMISMAFKPAFPVRSSRDRGNVQAKKNNRV